jgi:hypothetical protein
MESTKQPLNLIINESSVYYVTIQIAANVSVNYNISGTRMYYNTAGLTSPDDCNYVLSSVNPKCEIKICDGYMCNYDFDYIIVEITGGSATMDFTNIQRYWMDRNIRTVLFIGSLLLYLIYSFIGICIICCHKPIYAKQFLDPSSEEERRQLLQSSSQSPSHQSPSQSPKHNQTFFIIVLIFGFLFCCSIICLGVAFIFHTQQPMDVSAVVPISNDVANYPILLDSDLYKYASSITFTIIKGNSTIKLDFDEELWPNNNTITLHDNDSVNKGAINFNRQGLNYHRNDIPVNLAKGSNVTYKLNVSSLNDGGCIRLYLIYSADAYFMFINSTKNTTFNKYINRTECLLANSTSTVTFIITQLEGDYYVAYEAVNVSFTAEVNVSQVYYVPRLSQSNSITLSESYTMIYCDSFVCLNRPQLQFILMTKLNPFDKPVNLLVNSSPPYFDTAFIPVAIACIIGVIGGLLIIIFLIVLKIRAFVLTVITNQNQSQNLQNSRCALPGNQMSPINPTPPDLQNCGDSNIKKYDKINVLAKGKLT